ncbi:MAG: hypothetical protein QW035_00945 [Candidatus Anstonellales archaeon]
MKGFVDSIVEKRGAYIFKLKSKTIPHLKDTPQKNLALFMLCPEERRVEAVPKAFLKKAKKEEFFLKLRKEVKGPISWETLSKSETLFGEEYIEDQSFAAMFSGMTSAVDSYFGLFMEAIKGLPFFYTGKAGFEVDINCAGTAQCIAALYSMEYNPSNLFFLEPINSLRREKVLKALKQLSLFLKGEEIEFEHKLSPDGKLLDGLFLFFKGEWPDRSLIFAEVDTFHGGYLPNHLFDLLFDHVLLLEENQHIAVGNSLTNEIYDYPLEKDNLLSYNKMDIEKGLLLTALTNTSYLVDDLAPQQISDMKALMDSFRGEYKGSISFLGTYIRMLFLLGKIDKALEAIEELKQLYGEGNVPAKWLLIEAHLKSDQKQLERLKELLRERYYRNDAYDIISKRYILF